MNEHEETSHWGHSTWKIKNDILFDSRKTFHILHPVGNHRTMMNLFSRASKHRRKATIRKRLFKLFPFKTRRRILLFSFFLFSIVSFVRSRYFLDKFFLIHRSTRWWSYRKWNKHILRFAFIECLTLSYICKYHYFYVLYNCDEETANSCRSQAGQHEKSTSKVWRNNLNIHLFYFPLFRPLLPSRRDYLSTQVPEMNFFPDS